MERKWTEEQRRVIEVEERNLLVSAAAGSGKTAVLVERIIRKITDKSHPIDIDRLLIVTFTNAAAAEMRERIGLALAKALEKQPDNVHLQRQQTLLHNAQITTIHSFCLYVIRNYFHRIEMEPDFRVAEEGELKLLRSDVLDRVLEQYYQEAKPEFLALSETIATGKTDQPLKETILKLFSFAMSYPWVEEWLEECRAPFQVESMEEFEELPMTEALLAYLNNLSAQWARQLEQCVQISLMGDGPQSYAALLQEEQETFEKISACSTFEEYYECVRAVSFGRLPALRKFAGDAAKKERVQKLRNEVKASVKKITEQFFFQSPQKTMEDMGKSRPAADMLIEVTLAFIHAFAEKKREKNMLDFNDFEHYALKILVDEQSHKPSRTAEELRRNYEEIMIDEYQDSNNVQETILRAVSKEADGGHNIFMVGDVKQSIYRFRMARPELFMEKYDTYTLEESKNQRVDLHKNFRSRPEVIETVNDIFAKIMNHDIGNITYDAQAALYSGAVFPEGKPGMFDTRLLVVQPAEEDKELKAPDLEAKAVGAEIRRMMKEQLVKDERPAEGSEGALRPLRYGDVVILLRSLGSVADTFVKTLNEMGIPARATAGAGYFSAPEVQTALNLLKLVDNPRQDIPMAAALSSPVVGLSKEDLAALRVQFPEETFYQAVMHYISGEDAQKDGEAPGSQQKSEISVARELFAAQGEEAAKRIELSAQAKQRLQKFLHLLRKYRKKVSYTPIHQLLYEILEETGYQAYVYALPGGEVKRANLEMLVEKAIAYENTSYRGLFHFIRYMEQLRKYEVDFPLADGEETEDAVRIMSIHKSKGLEFPVVFVSGLGKMFNNQDVKEKVVLHPSLGIGMDVTDIARRLRTPGFTRQVLARRITMENIGEELRVLYVALTRAKEKLILTGVLKKAREKLEEWGFVVNAQEGEASLAAGVCMKAAPIAEESAGFLSFLQRLNTNNYLQLILLACRAYPGKYPALLLQKEDLAFAEQEHAVAQELTKIDLLARVQERDCAWDRKVEERLNFVYPYEEECTMRTKVSVSELKHRAMDKIIEEEMRGQSGWQQKEEERYVPAFMEGVQQENIGAKRGTAMHRVLECYDFTREADSLEGQLQMLEEQGKIEEDLLELVYLPALKKFLASPLASRMQAAAHSGKLYKEKPFVMGKPAREALEESGSSEMLLIQGIIDVFFEEEDGIVLLDYKTDSVSSGGELADRYRTQMELYQEAIERALGKTVKEKALYSFCLGEVVRV